MVQGTNVLIVVAIQIYTRTQTTPMKEKKCKMIYMNS